MTIELLNHTCMPEEMCGLAAALCTDNDNPSKSLQSAMDAHHDSVLEFAEFTYRICGISRVTLAQFTRHRMASFEVMGQRYNKVAESAQAIIPPSIRAVPAAERIYIETVNHSLNSYLALVNTLKIKPEDARYLLPEGMTCNLMVKMNARELLHFFSLRQCNRAQWEIRQMADQMALMAKSVAPNIFKNAGPGCVRSSCPEGKMCCKHPRTELTEEAHDTE